MARNSKASLATRESMRGREDGGERERESESIVSKIAPSFVVLFILTFALNIFRVRIPNEPENPELRVE